MKDSMIKLCTMVQSPFDTACKRKRSMPPAYMRKELLFTKLHRKGPSDNDAGYLLPSRDFYAVSLQNMPEGFVFNRMGFFEVFF